MPYTWWPPSVRSFRACRCSSPSPSWSLKSPAASPVERERERGRKKGGTRWNRDGLVATAPSPPGPSLHGTGPFPRPQNSRPKPPGESSGGALPGLCRFRGLSEPKLSPGGDVLQIWEFRGLYTFNSNVGHRQTDSTSPGANSVWQLQVWNLMDRHSRKKEKWWIQLQLHLVHFWQWNPST